MSEERISNDHKKTIDNIFNLKRIFFLCHMNIDDMISQDYTVPIFEIERQGNEYITTHSKYEDRIKYYILYLCKNKINIFQIEKRFIDIIKTNSFNKYYLYSSQGFNGVGLDANNIENDMGVDIDNNLKLNIDDIIFFYMTKVYTVIYKNNFTFISMNDNKVDNVIRKYLPTLHKCIDNYRVDDFINNIYRSFLDTHKIRVLNNQRASNNNEDYNLDRLFNQ